MDEVNVICYFSLRLDLLTALSMENFITGYPGHESQHRAAMLKVLGQEDYEFFFDKWLEYFFTDADAKYFASLGLNCLRLPFNYHHFEEDMNPRVLKQSGFKHLDRVVELVGQDLGRQPSRRPLIMTSALNTESTRSWTCTPRLVAKMGTGILITQQLTPPSGTTKTIRIAQSGCGSSLPPTTRETIG